MDSGVAVDPQCKADVTELQMKKTYRYVLLRLNEKLTEVVVEKKGDRDATYDDFVEDLKAAEAEKQCRFGVFDFEYMSTKGTGNERSKLFFIYWGPDRGSIKQKMVYSTTKDKLGKELGVGIAIQANDYDDLEWNNILEKVAKNDKI